MFFISVEWKSAEQAVHWTPDRTLVFKGSTWCSSWSLWRRPTLVCEPWLHSCTHRTIC